MQDSELKFTSPVRDMQICSEIRVSKPITENGRLILRRHHAKALWDTGAAECLISRRLAEELKLSMHERAILNTAAGAHATFKDIVLLDLLIDGSVIPVKAAVVDSIPGNGIDFAIGLDVIQCGTLTIDAAPMEGNFHVSFKPYPGLFRSIEQILKKK